MMRMNSRLCVIGAVLIVASTASGAVPAQDPIRAPFKNLQPAGVCESVATDSPAKTKIKPIAKPRRPADFGCAIEVGAAVSMLSKPNVVLVEMRSRVDYDAYHVDGSLNLQTSELKSKSYLKGRSLLLLGSGKGEHEHYTACAELKAAGFKSVRVLRGGMLAWLKERRPVVGSAPEATQLSTLSPAELFHEMANSHNLILSSASVGTPNALAGRAVTLPRATATTMKDTVARHKKVSKNAPLASIVLVLADGQERSLVSEMLATFTQDPVLIYPGPMSAYETFLETQNTMWKTQARGPKKAACPL